VAWQNQLTVVTSSVTAANTAQANATTIMGNSYNSFPSKLASINQSKQANATLVCTENYMLSNMHPTKTRSELRCKERLPISCSTSDTLVFAKIVMKRKKEQGWD
jgi:nucleotidyltransferase/DNA polymerase involved in DNA repair